MTLRTVAGYAFPLLPFGDSMPQPGIFRVALIATLLVVLSPLTLALYGPSMPAIAAAFGTTPAMVQQTLTVYLIAYALAQFAYGPLSDRFGRRPVVIVGLSIYVAGCILAGLSRSIEIMLVARVLEGIGACAGSASSRAIVRDTHIGAPAARIMSMIGMGLAVAPAVGPVVGGYMQVWFGWQSIFVLLSVAGALVLLVAAAWLPETNPAPNRSATQLAGMTRNYGALLGNRRYLGYVALLACTSAGTYNYVALSPFVLINTLGLTPAQFGWTPAVLMVPYLVTSGIGAHLLGRVHAETFVRMGCGVATLGALLLCGVVQAGFVTLPSIILPMMLWMVGIAMLTPGATVGALAPFPAIAGSAAALMGFAQMAAGAAGSFAAAAMGGASSQTLGLVPAALMLLGVALYVRLMRPASPLPATGS
jgi:DHA1 family bicyclomycin/chloramphenicol resistance-like MFS transporter